MTHGSGRLALVACAATLGGLLLLRDATARPALVEMVLNPTRDTYLGQNVGSAQDTAKELQVGWMYTTRGREFRAYLEFPLDPAKHPAAALAGAELWLYPEEPPRTSQIAATFVVRTMTEPFAEGRVAPLWFAAGEPSVERMLDREIEWKRFPVREHVLAILRAPDAAHGFEVSGKNQTDNTRWDFWSREGAEPHPGGLQPRLVLHFRDDAFPSPTPTPTRTADVTATTEATVPPSTATADATEAPSPTATQEPAPDPSPTAGPATTATPTAVPAGLGLYLPRAVRGS